MRATWALIAALTGLAATARADDGADRIEAVQRRAWTKRGSFALSPFAAAALNDPFLWRGGAGLRLTAWPRSLLGLGLEGAVWGQTPTADARTAQRELRARMRPAGSAWVALATAEIAAADGKVALGGRIVPFELFLRGGAGAAAESGELGSGPSAAFAAALGARWFLSARLGLDVAVAWRSSSTVREVSGRPVAAREHLVGLEIAVPWRIGGRP